MPSKGPFGRCRPCILVSVGAAGLEPLNSQYSPGAPGSGLSATVAAFPRRSWLSPAYPMYRALVPLPNSWGFNKPLPGYEDENNVGQLSVAMSVCVCPGGQPISRSAGMPEGGHPPRATRVGGPHQATSRVGFGRQRRDTSTRNIPSRWTTSALRCSVVLVQSTIALHPVWQMS